MAGVDYESVLCVKPQVHVFRIPPRPSNRGYRAADWKLDQPDWSGRLRLVAKGRDLNIKLEDKNSGDLFARCPIEQYPGIAVESVTDSSRYFVLRIQDDNGRNAFIGIGFEDRGDSFDLNVALQDHFKHLRQEKEAEKAVTELEKGPKLDLGLGSHLRQEKEAEKAVTELEKGPKLDLGFKEGQTIRINISTKKGASGEDGGTPKKERPKGGGSGAGGLGLLPPPPGGSIKLPPPGGHNSGPSLLAGPSKTDPSPSQPSAPSSGLSNAQLTSNASLFTAGGGSSSGSSNVDMLLDLDFGGGGAVAPSQGHGQGVSVGQSIKSPASDFGTNFDLLSGSDSAAGQSVPPAGGPSDPWGEFTSASASSDDNGVDWVQF